MAAASIVEQVRDLALRGGWCTPPVGVLMFNNFDLTSTSVLLSMFSGGRETPSVVAKLSEDRAALRRELEHLRTVRSLVPGLSPAPLFFETVGPFTALGMEGMAGRRVSTWDERLERLPAVLGRLVALHRGVRAGVMDAEGARRALAEPFEAVERLGLDPEVKRVCAATGGTLAPAMGGAALPDIPQHGDFHFDNILFHRDALSIVDWEGFGEVHVPGYDLFCLILNFYSQRDLFEAERFFDDRRALAVMRRGVETYFDAFGLPARLVRPLFVFTLIEQFRYSRRLGRSSAPRLLRRMAAYAARPERFDPLLGA